MIDIHCHLLPGLDDGPSTLDDALNLARQAVENGVTHSVITPHVHQGRWENTKASISIAVNEFRQALDDADIPLNIGFAGEVRIGSEVLDMAKKGLIPFLGEWNNHKVLLLEMPHSHILPGTEKIIAWLLRHDIVPMIAHPERNKDVIRKIDKLTPFIEQGCLFQLTAGSIIGQFGEMAQQRARQLLEKDVVTVVASDAHHISRRPVNLSEGRRAIAKLFGEEKAHRLCYENPLSITAQQWNRSI